MIKDEKKDFSWENAKKMMAKVDTFKEKLETYRGMHPIFPLSLSLTL
jgi:dynein heavy chain, axonemal